MTDRSDDLTQLDETIHRFVDNDLTPEERIRFVARLGRESALRERVIELDELALNAGRLPRAHVPAGFSARVIARTEAVSPWHRLAGVLVAPRVFHWNVATAGAAACVAALAGWFAAGWGTPAPGADRPATAAAESPSPVLVRLVVVQPGATTVQVAGDFNSWDAARTSLDPIAGGAWTVTLRLEPGRYEYMFLVDGRTWITDPLATELADDGFGSQNAVIDIRPAPAGADRSEASL
jgi:anti-sigma factor RsiW